MGKHQVRNPFQGLSIMGDNSQRGRGAGWGIKTGTVPPGSEGVCSPPYQLHGGVILFPAPQHHAHLTSGRGGKGGWKKEKKGEGAEAPARAPGRSGRPVRSSSPPRPLRASPAPAAASPPPRPLPRARGMEGGRNPARSPAPALPGSRASPARSPPASPPPPNQTTPPASERPRLAARRPLGPRQGWGGESGPRDSPPPRRPAGRSARPPALGWAG